MQNLLDDLERALEKNENGGKFSQFFLENQKQFLLEVLDINLDNSFFG